MDTTDKAHRKGVIGNPKKPGAFWLYDSELGFDLTHPESITSPTTSTAIRFHTTTLPITIDPAKSALVVIDMQNFFLSPNLGRPADSKGLQAQVQLLKYAIPAARKAGIRVVWLNWGLTQDEIDDMAPATIRAFGFETVAADAFEQCAEVRARAAAIDNHGINAGAHKIAVQTRLEVTGKDARIYRGLGADIGDVQLDDGSTVPGGRLLMRDQWNADLTPELKKEFQVGQQHNPADVLIHKNRMSGFWGQSTMGTIFLDEHGIKTLFFAGVNTDQCVGGSAQDAFSKSYDVILLSDGAATTSPSCAQEAIEFNCARTWGFCMSCEQFWNGVQGP